jgi:tol-pal system protein YbgF
LGGLRATGAALLLGLAAFTAHAGLFDDEEARRAILDLRTRIAAVEEASKARASELAAANAQLTEQLQTMRRNMLDLNNQLETLRADVAKLRGSDEQLQREVADLQRRQKDIAQGVDERIRKVEPQKMVVDGAELVVEPDERRMYDEAMAAMRNGDFEKSAVAFAAFERRWPASGLLNSVRFWHGNALYGKRDYKGAVALFKGFAANAPTHPRAPEAMLALANSQAEMKDTKGARKTIGELLKAYPQSEAAAAGRERLASLK